MKRIFIVLLIASLVLVSCDKLPFTPSGKVSSFLQLMSEGNPDKAMDDVCREGITVLPNLKFDWQNDEYKIISQDDIHAKVRMIGESRITEDDWEVLNKALSAYLETPVNLPPLFSVRVIIDYTWTLERDVFNDNWCVPEASLIEFFIYFVNFVAEEVLATVQ